MAIKNTSLGGTDWARGEAQESTDMNDTFNAAKDYTDESVGLKVATIYTGTGMNLADGDTTNTNEFTAISAANIGESDYLEIDVSGFCFCLATTSDQQTVMRIKIESKSVGGSYSDSLATYDFFAPTFSDTGRSAIGHNFKHLHTLTAGEKSAGVQIRITISKTLSGSPIVTFTNRQTTFKLLKGI